jgi:hypothetical protein
MVLGSDAPVAQQGKSRLSKAVGLITFVSLG